jgi:4'-phosphopantetheinyl transferase
MQLIHDSANCHVWKFGLDAGPPGANILSQEERGRASRFVKPVDSRRYERCHVQVRRILAEYLGVLPQNVPLFYETSGKLALRSSTLQISLAHSDDLALLAILPSSAVGVDLETYSCLRDLDVGAVSEVFSENEKRAIRGSSEPQLKFLSVFTRKEALAKGTGLGLARVIDQVDVTSDHIFFDQKHWLFESFTEQEFVWSLAREMGNEHDQVI